MTSSGMKRGLAVTAVSALAVTGLPFLTATANATPLSEQFGADAVHLYTADGTAPGAVSVRNDGVNTSVHLVSSGGANVAQVRYTYTHGTAEPVVIRTVSRVDGVFSTEWTPATNLLGETVTITAQALSNAGAIGAVDSQTVVVSANTTSVDIANAPGSNVGVFEQLYTGKTGNLGVVRGTTSALTTPVTLNGVEVNAANGGEYGEPANGTRTFKGVAEFGAYPFDTTDPKLDQAVVTAVAGSDDNEAVQVYAQKITSVSAAAANANPPASNATTTATVTVLDQRNNPVAGAEVVQEGVGGSTQYTDVNGHAIFSVAGDADGNSFVYTVNVDDDDAYQAAKDYQRTVTVTTYSDSAAGIAANHSTLGDALDVDEYDEAPVSITVTDGRGTARNAQTVQYSWSLNKFDPVDAPTEVVKSGSVTTGTDGKAIIPAPGGADGTYILNTYIERDGNPGQTAGDISGSTLRVKIGQASIVFEDDKVSQAAAGSSKEFDAKLVLADGTALPNREVTFNYTPGTETPAGAGDSIVAANQPSGTTRLTNNTAKDTTNAFGTVSVSLTDPSETTQPKELASDLNAETTGVNEADASNSGDSLRVDWLTSMAPVDADDIWYDTAELIDGLATPGRPVSMDIKVQNADGEWLTDYPVKVSIDHGSFTQTANDKSELVADPAPAAGGLYGEWKSMGKDQSLSSDDAGLSEATVNMERDAGFDDDGHVQMNVTIKAGPVTKVVPIDFYSGEDGIQEIATQPLNPGTLTVKRSAEQTISQDVLPNAPTTEYVNFDVIATDQFGNRVKAYVDINDDSAIADLAENMDGSRYDCTYIGKMGGYACYDYVEDEEFFSPTNLENNDEGGYAPIDNGDWVESQFTSEAPELRASSDAATNQRITGEWIQDQNMWEDGDTSATPAGEGFQPRREEGYNPKTLTDTTAPIHWYVIDWANLDSKLSRDTRPRVAIDSSVTETLTVKDQFGEPVKGLDVEFIRSGPNDQAGEDNEFGTTNHNGQTRYTFVGTERGLAKVTAVVSRDTDGDGDADEVLDKPTNSVRFVKTGIAATLKLSNRANGNDKALINAPSSAARAEVRLYKVRKNGTLQQLRKSTLNRFGNKVFVVGDSAKKKGTTYVARVFETRTTLGDTTPRKRIR